MTESPAPRRTSRRDFLKTGASLLAAPSIVPLVSSTTTYARTTPSDRITMALVGCGSMGRGPRSTCVSCFGVRATATR